MKRSIQKVDKCLSMIENAVIILGLSAIYSRVIRHVSYFVGTSDYAVCVFPPADLERRGRTLYFCICKFYWNQLCVPSKRTYPDGSGCKFIPSSRSPRVGSPY